MRRIISFTLGFLLILNTMLFFTYGENIDSVEKYRNEKYDDYIKNIENNEKYDEKIAPMEYSYNEKYISDTAKNSVARASLNLPKKYDTLTEYNIQMEYENQGTGSNTAEIGWSFASNDVLEIFLKKSKIRDKERYSEYDMLASTSFGSVPQQYAIRNNVRSDGDFSIASAYWIRGELNGPQFGSQFDCYNINESSQEKLQKDETDNIHVTDTVTLSPLNTSATSDDIQDRILSIKKMVRDNGAVFAKYIHFDNAFNADGTAYNNPDQYEIQGSVEITNGIAIVGWDDNYSAGNFGECKPNSNGAFIVVINRDVELYNGEKTVRMGKYYLSYDMVKHFTECSSVKRVVQGDRSKFYYEYDKKDHKGIGYSTGITNMYANKYNNISGEIQKIKSITSYCEVPGSYFNVYVSTDGNVKNLKKVKVNGSSTNGYYVANMGYFSVNLAESINVDNGEFIVAIEVKSPHTNSKSIPQEKNSVSDAAISGRCFISDSAKSMMAGTYKDCGSSNNIVKVYTDSINRVWTFDATEFSDLHNKKLEESKQINGLILNKNLTFSNSIKMFKGVKLTNYVIMEGVGSSDSNSIGFNVNGPSKIYVLGKSNNEDVTRRLAVYSQNSKTKIGEISLSKANGYCYKYEGSADKLFLYTIDDSVRIYRVAVEDYDKNKYGAYEDEDDDSIQYYDFSWIDSDTTLKSDTQYRGLSMFANDYYPISLVANESTSNNGYRTYYGLNLFGAGTDTAGTIAFDVQKQSDIYITARASSNGSRFMYLTNRYCCDLDTDIGGEGITITGDINTYKIQYNGDGGKLFLRSKSDGIRIMKIVVVPRLDWATKEDALNVDSTDELKIGEALPTKDINGYIFSGQAWITQSTSSDYTKAVKLRTRYYQNAGKITFEIGDSRGTNDRNPNRIIRVKAKADKDGATLILGNKYGYIFGSAPLSAELKEYAFDYSGDYETLDLFTYSRNDVMTEVYSISKTDINYSTDDYELTIVKDANGYGRCLLSVENVPNLNVYRFKLYYDKDQLTFDSFVKDDVLNNEGYIADKLSVSNNTSEGYLWITVDRDVQKYNWSGVLGEIKFKFKYGVSRSKVKLSAQKTA